MNVVLDQLLAISGRLAVASGVSEDSLASLRVFLAASLIQQNPGAVPIQPDPAVEAAINEAAAEGAVLASSLEERAVRIRVLKHSYVNPVVTPDRPTRVFGPFVDFDGSLVQFAVFESSRFLAVQLTLPAPFPLVTETLMLLHRQSFSNDGNRTFSIPPGTVWLRARFAVRNTEGYIGLRVKSGTLTIDSPAQSRPGNSVGIPAGAQWSLALEPEQPPAADGNGSDANSLTLQLPGRIEVRSTGESDVNGIIALSGFGSDLEFRHPLGAPFADADSITFPYDNDGAVWSIDGNLSTAAQLTGECRVMSAGWTLPINKLPLNTFGEAVHGGSLRLELRKGLESRMLGTAGTFKWFDTILTANATGVSLNAQQAQSSARSELDLWTPAHTAAVFAQQPIQRLYFSSLRDGRDIALVNGGEIKNKWDLPLTAAGKPFSYKGEIDSFAVIAERTGLLRVACSAIQSPETWAHGVVLENLYLSVREPRRLSFTGDYDGISRISHGIAVFFFDVMLAQPSLPDPYIANWELPDDRFTSEAALSIRLRWAELETPSVVAHIERSVNFPDPRDIPVDEPRDLRALFDHHLESHPETLNLLDLSSNEHLFGVAVERPSDHNVQLRDNRLTTELRRVRLLMLPQVQWEPMQVEPNDDANINADNLRFKTNGVRTLVGANSVKLVPVLPSVVGTQIVKAASDNKPAGALFSLPFGLCAFARMDPLFEQRIDRLRAVIALIHEPGFENLKSAQQLRLIATGGSRDPIRKPWRGMPGALRVVQNIEQPNANNLLSAFDTSVGGIINDAFQNMVPLHQADLSGYGLSTFSNWTKDEKVGVTQARFDVLNGRTSYEVIQVRSILAFCMAHVVRTVIFERRNSGKVLRLDSGWQPVDDGEFKQDDPVAKKFEFEKGVVVAFRNIRRIRVLETPVVVEGTAPDDYRWQQVLFDADAHLENVVAGGKGPLVPIRDHIGYIQLKPTGGGAEPDRARIAALLKKLGTMVGGPIDCKVRVGGILEMNLAGIFADEAPDNTNANEVLVVGAYGSPKLPRAGQWSTVRINGTTLEASPVDSRHGMPVIRRPGQPYTFREPGDVQRSNADEFGFLMSTPTSRVLFPKPSVDPNKPEELVTDKAHVADPYSLVQSTSVFPRPTYALRCNETPLFNISAENEWRLSNSNFTFTTPATDLVKGGEFTITRGFAPAPTVDVILDSAIQNKPWEISATPNNLDIVIDGIGKIFTIKTNYSALSGALPKLDKPSLEFGDALNAVKDVLSALNNFKPLTNFHIDVDVTAGTGPSPSFIVAINFKLRVGEGPNERIDIGIGKFYGEFTIRGQLETGLNGKTRGLLSAVFQGDLQQGIIPPAIYAGGFFRFAIQIDETGKPKVELGLGTIASIGGDLIKHLVEVEVTVKYAYTLIPQTLEPGVLLGLEARAKLLAGLVGFSFSVEAMARIKRVNTDEVTIWAQIRVCATVQIAWLVEDDIDIQTQFEQSIPLKFIAAVAFFPALAPAAAVL